MTVAPGVDRYHHVTEYYRRATEGHVYIRETLDALLDTVAARLARLGGTPRILELGSHAGVTTEALLRRCPEVEIIVSDDNEELVAMSRRRLADRRIEYHAGPVEALAQPVDLVISIARHHHLPHDYLAGVHRVMKPAAVYVVADELCPEYCTGEHAQRIARAEVLRMARGYVLTSRAGVAAFDESGTIPPEAIELEQLRRRALWRWYRFVVDHAVEHGYFDVAAAELQSARDDLVTGSDAEHKFGPLIVERQLALAGFAQLSKRLIGPPEDPERQSMFVYEYGLA